MITTSGSAGNPSLIQSWWLDDAQSLILDIYDGNFSCLEVFNLPAEFTQHLPLGESTFKAESLPLRVRAGQKLVAQQVDEKTMRFWEEGGHPALEACDCTQLGENLKIYHHIGEISGMDIVAS